MRSSGWVEQPATMEAIPPSRNPLKPIFQESKFSRETNKRENGIRNREKYGDLIWETEKTGKGELKRPVGIGVHLTGNQEMGMKAEGYGGIMRNDGSVRHMLTEDYVIRG